MRVRLCRLREWNAAWNEISLKAAFLQPNHILGETDMIQDFCRKNSAEQMGTKGLSLELWFYGSRLGLGFNFDVSGFGLAGVEDR